MFGKKKKIIQMQREENLKMAEELQAFKDQKSEAEETQRKRAEVDSLFEKEREDIEKVKQELAIKKAELEIREAFGEEGMLADKAAYFTKKMDEFKTKDEKEAYRDMFLTLAEESGKNMAYSKGMGLLKTLKNTDRDTIKKLTTVMSNKITQDMTLDYDEPKEIKKIVNNKKKNN